MRRTFCCRFVVAALAISVALVWACRPARLQAQEPVPFPKVHKWKSVVITLTKMSSFPPSMYKVEVHGDGTVFYDGVGVLNGSNFGVAITGKHRCTAPKKSVRELVTQFRDADFFSLSDKYEAQVFDAGYSELSIVVDGKRKSVTDVMGYRVGMPRAVGNLEGAVGQVADVRRWTVGEDDLVDCLRKEGWDFHSQKSAEMLASVAQHGTIEVVQDLLRAGAPMYAGEIDTPLVLAAGRGNVEMMRVLRSAGAGKNDKSELAVALANAVYEHRTNAANELLDWMAGADADECDESKFMVAARSGVISEVRLLLPGQTDINARDKKGRTALMLAVQQDGDERSIAEVDRFVVVRDLLEAGADVNLRDEQGNTALMYSRWDESVTRELLAADADIDARNNSGETALMLCGSPDVAWLLLANHADASTRNAEGKTALDLAREKGMKEKEEVLVSGKRSK